ncbi:glycosyltransferase family 1 protein [Aeromonas dhakensis]|uniref:glycosyltransferase family 1 protein n=1 Tax=Aeromonas dhakensis TaxID=196024 RepID=UPI001BFCAF82|nr:glycosyltransferase family 1 protein [Aeromonas dhakensis]HDT5890685.1 glycosyltransferase family 1 protein [Aeromonas dhakensis]HEB4977167.1 glycosyltransferase family 1 protein [Aeromonas dhakensis]
MDELIRKVLFRPYSKLNKQSYGNQHGTSLTCQSLLILHEGYSPTLAYFEAAIRSRFIGTECRLVDISKPTKLIIDKGTALVIIRFISPLWQQMIEENIDKLSRIVYFMDDDLFDPQALKALPKEYRTKIIRRSSAQHRWITEHCDDIWVSTPYLAQKYAHLNPDIISAKPSTLLLGTHQPVKIAYHGSSSHRDEKYWLRHVIEGVLACCPQASFEIFGEHEIYKLYRDLPRVSVLHPMTWQNYLAYTKSHKLDIGLAPLLDSDFNLARGPVKFYDFVRMGAVGVYSNCAPYSDFIDQNISGILLENDQEKWIKTLSLLVNSEEKRRELAHNAKEHAYSLVS